MSAARRAAPRAARKAPVRRTSARPSPPVAVGVGRAWLVKTEPSEYSLADLARERVTGWDGVRNYQARNLLRDAMRPGDPVLVYHSNAEPMAIVGLARVAGPPRPDETQFRKGHPHHDPDSRPDDPRWWLVDIEHVETFRVPLERAALAAEPALRGMELLRRGSRLSVQPVTPAELAAVLALARSRAGR